MRPPPRSDTAPGSVEQLRQDKQEKEKGKEKQALKERFSFGLGRKKSSRFLSPLS
jgi:ubiquitin carboxyl-terminal hydrolase 9/13